MISVERVSKSFGPKQVLDAVSFEVPDGKVVAVLGPSGTGKTVLLRVLAGLARPDAGRVSYDGSVLRPGIGFVFQSGALFDSLTVAENVGLPLAELTAMKAAAARRRVDELLEMVGLRDARDLYPRQLSGGMIRLAALGRALALDPRYLFYDEPTTGLDPVVRDRICALIADLRARAGKTQVVVTHDLEAVRAVADEILMLRAGRLVALDQARKEDYEKPCA